MPLVGEQVWQRDEDGGDRRTALRRRKLRAMSCQLAASSRPWAEAPGCAVLQRLRRIRCGPMSRKERLSAPLWCL